MRHEPSPIIACVGVLLAWAAGAGPAHAAAPRPSYVATRVEVDATKLEGGGSTMEKSVASLSRNEVQQAVSQGLAAHLPVVDEGGEAIVHVELLWRDYETSYYGVRMEIRRGGKAELVAVDECKLCDEGKLAAKVAARVPDLLPYLESEAGEVAEVEPGGEAQPEAEPEPGTSDAVVGPEAEPDVDDGQGYRRVGVAGYVGIASLALGVAGVVGGIPVLLEDPTRRPTPDDDSSEDLTDRRPLGVGLTATGVGLLVVGAVVIAVDQTVLRKQRDRRSRTTAWIPSVSPHGVGLSWAGRF